MNWVLLAIGLTVGFWTGLLFGVAAALKHEEDIHPKVKALAMKIPVK